MSPVHTIVAKELRCYFVSPIVYVVGAVFLGIVGLLSYWAVVEASNQALRMMQMTNTFAQINVNDLVFRKVFYHLNLVSMLVLPLLTMRLFAEERKLRTFELLLTSPVGINEIVTAKFLSVLIIYCILLTLTALIPMVLSAYVSFHWDPVLTGYLALFLQGAFLLAVGLVASALTENQIIAAFLSFGCILVLWLLGAFGSTLGDTPLGQVFSYISFIEHYDRLVRGLVHGKDLVYYISGLVLMWFAAHQVVDAHRWY